MWKLDGLSAKKAFLLKNVEQEVIGDHVGQFGVFWEILLVGEGVSKLDVCGGEFFVALMG